MFWVKFFALICHLTLVTLASLFSEHQTGVEPGPNIANPWAYLISDFGSDHLTISQCDHFYFVLLVY